MTPPQQLPALQALLALRYQVFCVERGFLAAEAYPLRQEHDEFDPWAEHFAVLDAAGSVVGSARLVPHLPRRGFPFQSRCRRLHPDPASLPVDQALEVSRLVVSRQRRHDEIVLRLYRAMYQHSKRMGVTHWYAAMEKSLVRLLARYGVAFTAIGPEVDYYGRVTPYLASLADLETSVRREHPHLCSWFKSAEEAGAFRVVRLDSTSN